MIINFTKEDYINLKSGEFSIHKNSYKGYFEIELDKNIDIHLVETYFQQCECELTDEELKLRPLMNSLYLNSKKSNILLYSKKPFGNSNIEQDIKFLIGFCEEDTFDKFLNLAKKLFEHGTITCSTYYNDGMVWNKTEETIRIEKLEKILKINLVV